MTVHRLLLSLFTLALSACCLPSPLTAQPQPHEADSVFSGWSITAIAPHPSQPLVHLVDQRRFIHSINLTTGSVIREGYIVSGVEAAIDYLTVDRLGNIYAVLTSLFHSELTVLALDEQLQPRHQFRLDMPADMGMTLLDRPLLTDTRGVLYVVGRLTNGSHIVYSYEGSSGKRLDVWLVRSPIAGLSYVVNMDAANFIYFQQTSLLSNGHRYTFLFSTGGVWSDTIVTEGSGCSTVTSIAVNSRYDVALVCDRSDLRLFTSDGDRLDSFQFITDGMILSGLAIDWRDTLLVVTPSSGGAVVAVPTSGSGAKHVWRPNQSSFLDAAHLTYDRFTDTLLTWHSAFTGSARPIQRVDARSGALVDLLWLPDRLTVPVGPNGNSNCYVRSASVGQYSGLLYRLLTCALPTPHLRLYVTTAAGQLRRELSLMGWTNRFAAPLPMAVDEQLDVALVALYGLTSRFGSLFAFSLSNGTALYNVSLGQTGYVTDLTASANHTALLTLPSRILVLSMADGTTLHQVDAPAGVQYTSAAYDGLDWYFGQSSMADGGLVNGSVVVWNVEKGAAQAVLVVGGGHRQTWLQQPTQLFSVSLTDDGRVFALDRFRLAAYWQLRRHTDTAPATVRTATADWSHGRIGSRLAGVQQ